MKINIKKIFFLSILAIIMYSTIVFASNWQWWDTNYKFNYAYVKLPTGQVIQGECQKWRDYDDCDEIQVIIDNIIYYTAAENIVLIYKSE